VAATAPPANVNVPLRLAAATAWLAVINCTDITDLNEYLAVPLTNWKVGFPLMRSTLACDARVSVMVEPSGYVTMVGASPAFTTSPASTGHAGTPVFGLMDASRKMNRAEEVTVAT
jgi:hypothetical protein